MLLMRLIKWVLTVLKDCRLKTSHHFIKPKFVKIVPFLNKNDPSKFQKIKKYLFKFILFC